MRVSFQRAVRRWTVALTVVFSSAGLAFAAFAPAAGAAPPSPPFTQCPAVGASASCSVLIVINADGSATVLTDPSQGAFDGSEDTLVGVQNNSNKAIAGLPLTATVSPPIFGFEGDGLCAGYTPGPTGCPFGPTGYEGPNTSFSGISSDENTGTVNFTGGLAAGASAYFSLEGPPTTQIVVGPPPPLIIVKINKDGGPMCADNRKGVRVNLVVKPRANNTVLGVVDAFMHYTGSTSAPNAWVVHLKSNGTPPTNTIPAHTATVTVHTSAGDVAFTVSIPAFTCT
jgi:hypothetical protein